MVQSVDVAVGAVQSILEGFEPPPESPLKGFNTVGANGNGVAHTPPWEVPMRSDSTGPTICVSPAWVAELRRSLNVRCSEPVAAQNTGSSSRMFLEVELSGLRDWDVRVMVPAKPMKKRERATRKRKKDRG